MAELQTVQPGQDDPNLPKVDLPQVQGQPRIKIYPGKPVQPKYRDISEEEAALPKAVGAKEQIGKSPYRDISEEDAAPLKTAKPKTEAPKETPSFLSSVGGGIESGVTMDLHPLMKGLEAAGGMPEEHQSAVPSFPHMVIGGARMGYEALTDKGPSLPQLITGEPTGGPATQAYDKTRSAAEELDKQKFAAHSYGYLGGQLIGSTATLPLLPFSAPAKTGKTLLDIAELAKYGGKLGVTGGGISGWAKGHGTVDSLVGGAEGAGIGLAAGTITGAAGKAIGVPLKYVKDIVQSNFPHGAYNVAVDRVTQMVQDAWGKAPQKIQEATEAAQRGQPSAIIDAMTPEQMGPKGLIKGAANVSARAFDTLSSFLTGRMGAAQQQRMQSFGRDLVLTRGDSPALMQAEREAYDASRRVNYTRAYEAGDHPLWSPELERLANSPSVATAARSAVHTGQDYAVAEGYGGFNPNFEVTPDGRLQWHTRGGVPTYPNLQYWDYVARNLRGMAQAVQRNAATNSGTSAGALDNLARQLNNELDRLVPEYRTARGRAAEFFGANDAAEAGREFVRYRGDNREFAPVWTTMSPKDRMVFADGYVSTLLTEIGNVPDQNDVTATLKQIFSSPNARARHEMILGPEKARELEAYVFFEKGMAEAKRAIIGNSTTAQQLAGMKDALGIAGHGAGGGVVLGGGLAAFEAFSDDKGINKKNMLITGLLGTVGAALAKRGRIQQAEQIVNLLASDNWAEMHRGLMAASKDPLIMQGIRDIPRFFNEIAKRGLTVQSGTVSSEGASAVRQNPDTTVFGGT